MGEVLAYLPGFTSTLLMRMDKNTPAVYVGMTLIGVIGKIIGWRQKTRIWQKLMKAFCEHQLAMYGIYNKEYYYFKNDIYIFNET